MKYISLFKTSMWTILIDLFYTKKMSCVARYARVNRIISTSFVKKFCRLDGAGNKNKLYNMYILTYKITQTLNHG